MFFDVNVELAAEGAKEQRNYDGEIASCLAVMRLTNLNRRVIAKNRRAKSKVFRTEVYLLVILLQTLKAD